MSRTSALRSVWPARAPVRIGLVGFGTVGSAVARILEQRADESLRLARICVRDESRPRPGWLPADVEWTARFDDLLAPDIDVLVELVGGLSPAREWVTRALLAGKSVVTANKQLVAEEGRRLAGIAARQRRQLRYGASVAGGVPVLDAVRLGLAGDRLTSIAGVINGTCNYILTRIEEAGIPFAEALAEAQALGYAESDPTADVEGFDARAKLSILCAAGFDADVPPSAIACASIASVGPADFAEARAKGATIRQVSRAARSGDPGAPPHARSVVRARVGPELVSLESPLARVKGCENAVIVTGRHGGDTLYAGRGAGGEATAVAVIADILAIANNHSTGGLR
jgi:homoserine dehydrogenase